jgi:cullin-associated NEDD8-dissociated protein 1
MYVIISITGHYMLESNELDRDMSLQKDTFVHVIQHFESEQEEIRSAAAFAAGTLTLLFFLIRSFLTISLFLGNIAIGNLQQFLPAIIKMVESDPKKRLLSLHALKEVRNLELGGSSTLSNGH